MSDWWDDFSNNLATDLAPLLALFGEAPTKQYLSECLGFLDIIIFAACPLGVITAIVSTIRVCGTPSLRAFVGRAQEGGGNAEAELCSSTSRDVCELYNNGGITRVFGRPKLLEFIHDPTSSDDFYPQGNEAPTAGIYSSIEYFDRKSGRYRKEWTEKMEKSDEEQHQESRSNFAPNPNLSLNVGIKPRKRLWFIAAATLGLVLQTFVLVWAVLTRYILGLVRNDPGDAYAVPMTIIGTFTLCTGMASCAFLIEKSTGERVFERSLTEKGQKASRIFWVQPGNQLLGDQVFDSFAYTHPKGTLNSYRTSWKKEGMPHLGVVLASLFLAAFGFAAQFVGLRACHSSVAVLQLGTMLVMSLVRASLRADRFSKEENPFASNLDFYHGHELDWIALEMENSNKSSFADSRPGMLWKVSNLPRSDPAITIRKELSKSTDITEATRIFSYRSRLARLTGIGVAGTQKSSSWDESHVVARETAKALGRAIQQTTEIIFNKSSTRPVLLFPEWEKTSTIFCPIQCSVSRNLRRGEITPNDTVYLSMRRESLSDANTDASWHVDTSELEAVLGLWLWSLKAHSTAFKNEDESPIAKHTKVTVGYIISGDIKSKVVFSFWLGKDYDKIREASISTPLDPNGLWYQRTDQIFHLIEEKSRDFPDKSHRFVGWHVVSPTQNRPVTTILEIPTGKETMAALSHEIYALFLMEALRMVQDIGGHTTIDPESLYHTNDTISSISQAFTESGLGSAQDAAKCIIPVLQKCNKVPAKDKYNRTALSYASAQMDGYAIVKDLVDYGWSIDEQDQSGRTPLSYAAECGDIKTFEYLFMKGALPDTSDESNRSPLSYATGNGRVEVVKKLIQDGRVDLDLQDSSGSTPLCWSAKAGCEEVVKQLLQAGTVNPQQADKDGWTPLMHAASKGHKGTVKILVETGKADWWTPLNVAVRKGYDSILETLLTESDMDATTIHPNALNSSLLQVAAEEGFENIFRLLLEVGRVDPTQRNKDGLTPLMSAASHGREGMVKQLLKSPQVNPDTRRGDGSTVLMDAVRIGHEGIVKLLLDRPHVNLDATRDDGSTVLMDAVGVGNEAIVRLLLEKPQINPEARRSDGSTALMDAVKMGHEGIVKLLLERSDVIPDAKRDDGSTPLMDAVRIGNEAIVKQLLDTENVDPSWRRKDGSTALFFAVNLGHEGIVRKILDVSKEDLDSSFPAERYSRLLLHIATDRGFEGIADLLIKSGATPDKMNRIGWTPLMSAANSGQERMVELLLRTGRVDPDSKNPHDGNLTPLMYAAKVGHEGIVTKLLDTGMVDPNLKNTKGETALELARNKGYDGVVRLLSKV